jgi:hypothetical protein
MADTVDVAMNAAEARHWAAKRTAVILLAAAGSSIGGWYAREPRPIKRRENQRF